MIYTGTFPWAVLEARATARFGKPRAQVFDDPNTTWTFGDLAEIIGFKDKTIAAWKARGTVPMMHADRIALAFDDHPITFVDGWEEWAAAELTVEKAEQRQRERAKKQRQALAMAGAPGIAEARKRCER